MARIAILAFTLLRLHHSSQSTSATVILHLLFTRRGKVVSSLLDVALALFKAAGLVLAAILSYLTRTRLFSVSFLTLAARVNGSFWAFGVDADQALVMAFGSAIWGEYSTLEMKWSRRVRGFLYSPFWVMKSPLFCINC